ncbi:erythromycin esterase family protein [Streptomyces spinosirectus]
MRKTRLERAIGVICRPETERQSHFFRAGTSDQFDGVIHIDGTRAVEPAPGPTIDSSSRPIRLNRSSNPARGVRVHAVTRAPQGRGLAVGVRVASSEPTFASYISDIVDLSVYPSGGCSHALRPGGRTAANVFDPQSVGAFRCPHAVRGRGGGGRVRRGPAAWGRHAGAAIGRGGRRAGSAPRVAPRSGPRGMPG